MGEVDLFGDPVPDPAPDQEQAQHRAGAAARLDASLWTALLACEETAAAYDAATYRRGEYECWYWTAALSNSGHGKIKAGRAAPGAAAGRTVTAHVYGYQRAYGLITPNEAVPDPVVAHRCDEPSCQQPQHMEVIDRAENIRDFHRRRHTWPLNDTRTTAGRKSARAEALREAIRRAQAAHERAEALHGNGEPVPADLRAAADIEAALYRASEAGRPPEPLKLF